MTDRLEEIRERLSGRMINDVCMSYFNAAAPEDIKWLCDEVEKLRHELKKPCFVGVDMASGPDYTVECYYEDGNLRFRKMIGD